MARPHGFDHFCAHLKGLEGEYVIIGGGAASILMDDAGLEFRATKDVDLVFLTRSRELNRRLLDYIDLGGYKTKESSEGLPRYYRFKNPENTDCPAMIEIFARNELGLELRPGQHIIPIKNDPGEGLSAILLDDEYFDLIKGNLTVSGSGIPLINAVANICLKARAHRELFERRAAGDATAEEKAVQKHLKDIWRLAVTLTGDEAPILGATPLADINAALAKLSLLPEAQFKQVMAGVPGVKMEDVMAVLENVFRPSHHHR